MIDGPATERDTLVGHVCSLFICDKRFVGFTKRNFLKTRTNHTGFDEKVVQIKLKQKRIYGQANCFIVFYQFQTCDL